LYLNPDPEQKPRQHEATGGSFPREERTG